MIRRVSLSLLFLLFSLPLFAADLELNPDHPQQYEVVRGDTLWDISGRFLKYPWHWPELWSVNSYIKNPHLIYPGDLLTLVYRDGKPVLELTRGSTAYKMSPEVREIELERAIPTIPLDEIVAFLSRPQVLDEDTLNKAPYIVAGSEERLISGTGDKVYARGLMSEQGKNFSVFLEGKVYQDPETGEVLGYEAIYKGNAFLTAMADPATLVLRKTNREILAGDRLLPVVDDIYDMTIFPRPPEHEVNGQIISVFNGVSQVGQYQVVVLNRGGREGLEIGHVLSVLQAGNTIVDPILSGIEDETYFTSNKTDIDRDQVVTLPDEQAGVAMVFKVFEKVSYAIIMKATKAIHVSDKVSSVE